MNLSVLDPCILHSDGPQFQGALFFGVCRAITLLSENEPFTLAHPGGEVIASFTGVGFTCSDRELHDLISESVYAVQSPSR